MNEVFPAVSALRLSEATPGTILKLPRSGGSLVALVTDQVRSDGNRSVVVLNGRFSEVPSVFLADNWADMDSCLSFRSKVHFELTTDEAEIDPRGNRWRDVPGVIVLIGDQMHIRVAPRDSFFENPKLVNVHSGVIFSQQAPNSLWTFGRWSLWIRGSLPEQRTQLMEFSAIMPEYEKI